MPFTRVAIKKAFKGIREKATGFILLTILFLVVGLLQYAFVDYQLQKTTKLQLNGSADEIAGEIYKNDSWDLDDYEQAFVSTSTWYVFSSNGLLIDNEFPVPSLLNLFHSVEFSANLIFETPQTITSEVGGQYRVLARKIRGGTVIVGIDIEEPTNSSCAECVDERLEINLAKFGSDIKTAVAVSTRQVSQDLSYAVISDSGELESGLGDVPLKVDASRLIAAANSGGPIQVDNKIYILVARSILDSKNKIVGTIIVPGDITFQQQAMGEQLKFNLSLSALAFVVAVLISIYFIGRELARVDRFEKLPEALKTPENMHKEFKSSFQWDINNNCKKVEERWKTLKTVTAFLNSEGGVLFIGVNDNQTIRGLNEDLNLFNGSTDKFQLQIVDLISDRIGPEFSPLINIHCESTGGKTVCVIKVEKATEPAFLKDDNKSHFYTREGNRTNELDPKETTAFIRSKRWNR